MLPEQAVQTKVAISPMNAEPTENFRLFMAQLYPELRGISIGEKSEENATHDETDKAAICRKIASDDAKLSALFLLVKISRPTTLQPRCDI